MKELANLFQDPLVVRHALFHVSDDAFLVDEEADPSRPVRCLDFFLGVDK